MLGFEARFVKIVLSTDALTSTLAKMISLRVDRNCDAQKVSIPDSRCDNVSTNDETHVSLRHVICIIYSARDDFDWAIPTAL